MNFAEQERLLDDAEREGVPLDAALAARGKTMDDLVYARSRDKAWTAAPPPALGDFDGGNHRIPVASFFAGCGGVDLGFEAAGFDHVAAFEHNRTFCDTMRANRPGWRVLGPPGDPGDVSNIPAVIAALEPVIQPGFDGVFTGGPPCQPFSIAANQRFTKDDAKFKRVGFGHEKNGGLLFDFAALIRHFRPAAFLIENVPGLRDMDGGKQLSGVLDSLAREGYDICPPVVLDAADHGVPQARRRLFVMGSRTGRAPELPRPGTTRHGAGSVLDGIPRDDPNSATRDHKPGSVRRYARLDYGQRDKLGRLDRLSPVRPAPTVIAGGTGGGGVSNLHPEIPRTLSPRECARLQTFPDDYVFEGIPSRQFTQIGNAVPPVLAARLARSLAKSAFGA